MLRATYNFALLAVLSASVSPCLADPNDWVNVNYVVQSTGSSQSSTANARLSIINAAETTAKGGPWSVTNSKGILAPSRDQHDYLSWAPYHWPDCNWCAYGRTYVINKNPDATRGDTSDNSAYHEKQALSPDGQDDIESYDEGVQDSIPILSVIETPNNFVEHEVYGYRRVRHIIRDGVLDANYSQESSSSQVLPLWDANATSSLSPQSSSLTLGSDTLDPTPVFPQVPVGGPPPARTALPAVVIPIPGTGSSDRIASGTSTPPQAAAKTPKASCTPSPTKSLAPSATWTTCRYVPRDGVVNPDVRTLNGPDAANSMAQSVLYNAIAYALQRTTAFSQMAASLIDVFFLAPSSRMNPNVNFGQVVRGPGPTGQEGTFTGILDLRGIVKVANAIMILKATRSPDWTPVRDHGILGWMEQYITWLSESDIGKSTAAKANNHVSFYVLQLAAVEFLVGNSSSAAAALQNFFAHQFLDQIAASGEQPFEAVRTRPYHYRCFNLEALIAIAKLGDQLGLNFWSNKSRYGATIQTALDYTMRLDPKDEDVNEILPHVAAAAAAYGDPKGIYRSFLQKTAANYDSKPYWFYDQTAAIPNSPAGRMSRRARSIVWSKEDTNMGLAENSTSLPSSKVDQPIPFQCPSAFADTEEVELDDGLFTTCGKLEPFYKILSAAV